MNETDNIALSVLLASTIGVVLLVLAVIWLMKYLLKKTKD